MRLLVEDDRVVLKQLPRAAMRRRRIVITARDALEDRVAGLDAGADPSPLGGLRVTVRFAS